MKKTVILEEETHRILDILRAEKQFRSFDEAVNFLLDYYREREETLAIPA